MKIKYRKSDNVVVAMISGDILPDSDHDVEEINSEIPSNYIQNYIRVEGGIQKRSQVDIDGELDSLKTSRKNIKREVINAIATVTGLTKAKIIKGLKMALDDGNDD